MAFGSEHDSQDGGPDSPKSPSCLSSSSVYSSLYFTHSSTSVWSVINTGNRDEDRSDILRLNGSDPSVHGCMLLAIVLHPPHLSIHHHHAQGHWGQGPGSGE